MSRDYAPTLPELDEDVSYRAELLTIDIEDKEFEGKSERRAKLLWRLNTGELLNDFVTVRRDSHATLGFGPNGPSKLRQLLEAVYGQRLPKSEWFDSTTAEFGFGVNQDEVVLGKLEPGVTVVLKGEMQQDKNGQDRPKVTKYKALPAAKPEPAANEAVPVAEGEPVPVPADSEAPAEEDDFPC